MANLRPERDRGQLLLVAAFILAITFVVLALVVNSAIFTENLATREDVAGSHDALDTRYEVQTNVGYLLAGVNNETEASQNARENDLDDAIGKLDDEGSSQQATQGRLVSVTDLNIEDYGTIIAQEDPERNFTSADGDDDWYLTGEGDFEVRDFQIHLTEPDELGLDSILFDEAFTVILNDTSSGEDEWSMTVTEDDSIVGDGLNITVQHPAGAASCTRSYNDFNNLSIDVTGATVDGTPCPALGQLQDEDGTHMWLGSGLDEGADTRLEFKNAGEIEGTYSMVINDQNIANTTNLVDERGTEDPYYDNQAIYSVLVHYEYYTSAVGYETDIRVAPGEVPS